MKNKEKYFDEIIESFTSDECTMCDFKKNYVLELASCSCIGITCVECCQRTKEWLEQEYQEPIILTDDEKAILKNLPKMYKWIARDENGTLYLYFYFEKPLKKDDFWKSGSLEFDFSLYNQLFQFIKWEDKEPYDIDELLKQNGIER